MVNILASSAVHHLGSYTTLDVVSLAGELSSEHAYKVRVHDSDLDLQYLWDGAAFRDVTPAYCSLLVTTGGQLLDSLATGNFVDLGTNSVFITNVGFSAPAAAARALTIPSAGDYRCSGSISYAQQLGGRQCLLGYFADSGSVALLNSPTCSGSYTRTTGSILNADHGSISLPSTIFSFSAGDTVGFGVDLEADSADENTVTLEDGVVLTLEKII